MSSPALNSSAFIATMQQEAAFSLLSDATWRAPALSAALVGAVLAWLFFRMPSSRKGTPVAGPRGWPVVGNLPELLQLGLLKGLLKWHQTYGPLFKIRIGPKEMLVVSDPELVRSITLKHFKVFSNRPLQANLVPEHSTGILFNRDNHWTAARGASFPLFHGEQLRAYVGLMSECISRLVGLLSALPSGGEVDIIQVMKDLTFDVFSCAAFGESISSKAALCSTNVSTIISLSDKAADSLGRQSFTSAAAVFTGYRLATYIFWALSQIPGTPEREVLENFLERKKVALSLLRDRKQEGEDRRGNDLLGMLYRSQAEAKGADSKLTDSELVGITTELLIAGSETTATTLGLAVALLSCHPESEARVVAEVQGALQAGKGLQTYDDLTAFPYVQMVLKETLRLFPPGVSLVREAAQDTVLGGISIRKGQEVIIPALCMHRSSDFFEDADCFKPDRFDPAVQGKDNLLAYLPFGSGPRMCLGDKFAMMEATMALIALYAKFKFTLSGHLKGLQGKEAVAAIELGDSIVLRPKEPILIQVTAR